MKLKNTIFLWIAFIVSILWSITIFSQDFRKEAFFYEKLENKLVQCHLCPKKCVIPEGKYGFCRARKNIGGTLYAMGYGKPCSVALDPIEKKPFFHFLPGTTAFSLASAGCSLRCKFCQNWQISQYSPEETENYDLPPEKVVEYALKYKNDPKYKCSSIAFTYSEPVNFYEYMFDTAKIAKKKGLKNVIHTAGYINPEPLEKLLPYIDAINVDLKGFNEQYYRNMCEGDLKTVLNTLKILKKNNIWIEITNLILPGYNDEPEEIKKMCIWIKENLGEDTPIHFSRFQPMYQMAHLNPTPQSTLEKAADVAKNVGLKYVYIGNMWGHLLENTFCPKCKKMVIKRAGYTILENNIKDGRCKFCGEKIAGVF